VAHAGVVEAFPDAGSIACESDAGIDVASVASALHEGQFRVDDRAAEATRAVSVWRNAAACGDGSFACSGDMLLEALVACVALRAMATAIGVELRDVRVTAEGELDFRGTLGVAKEVPVDFQDLRLRFVLDTDATDAQRAKLISLTERYCVVLQTLRSASPTAVEVQ
jgi:uncharacterized OsmC-like protein